jgi:hypothetical protein
MDDISDGKKHWIVDAPTPYAPGKGSFKSDLLRFGVLVFLQTVVLAGLDLGHLKFDLFTPWLVVCVLRMSYERTLFFFGAAILIMESSSSAPAGLYLVAYSMIGIFLHVVKHQISWRRTVSWLYAMAAATSILGILEMIVLYISEPTRQLGFYGLTWGSRIAIASLLIFLVPSYWLSDDWMEEGA